jgi:predicted nucleotidyltransferase
MTANQIQILAILIEHPDRDFYLGELGVLMGKLPGVFQKGINALEREGWVSSRQRGKQRFFQINAQHPLFVEMKALVRKSAGAEPLLAAAVNSIPSIRTALIYGSYAKDKMRAASDIDLLVVTDDLRAEDVLVSELSRIERSLQRDVNYKIYDEKDFKQRRKHHDPFLAEVLSDKYIILKGLV